MNASEPFWRRQIYATRLSAHVVFAVLVWPVLIVAGTALDLMSQPYVSADHRIAIAAAFAGLLLSLPDLVAVGAIFFGVSALIFRRFGPETTNAKMGFLRLGVEPALTFVAAAGGASFFYPAVMSGAVFAPLHDLPVGMLSVGAGGLASFGGFLAARPGSRSRLALSLLLVAALAPLPVSAARVIGGVFGRPPEIIVLGLDSVSQSDDVTTLRNWAAEGGGTWYEYPVAPGLLTNAVWSSILTMKPVREHRVFHTFQQLDDRAVLLDAARSKGYRTAAVFPDQLTCAVGSRAGFDRDLGGAVGWRQVLLPSVANNSLLIPLIRPALPRVWPLTSRPNQAGTYTYDLRREIRTLLRAGSADARTLVASHLTYTHLAAYPNILELSPEERWNVFRSPAGLVRDRSLDWQDTDRPDDPIALQAWKLRNLQEVIRSEVEAAGFLEEGRSIVIFSDHGHRRGLFPGNFADPRYHRVVLTTFGLPASCPSDPVSLIDIGRLIGLSPGHAAPEVEFAIAPLNMWPQLMRTAKFGWNGDVELDPGLLGEVFAELAVHQPWRERGRSCSQLMPTATSRNGRH